MSLECVPEWCEQGDEHDATCPLHLMEPITKGDFVDMAEGIARQAVTAYLFMLNEGLTPEEALEVAVDEENEAAVCFAGIGSCGRGWCKH